MRSSFETTKTLLNFGQILSQKACDLSPFYGKFALFGEKVLFKKLSVLPGFIGFLYKNNKFQKELESGVYKFFKFGDEFRIYQINKNAQNELITNQEILTKDSISLRFSFWINYQISQTQKILDHFEISDESDFLIKNFVVQKIKIYMRNFISKLESTELNERNFEINLDEINENFSKFGIEILEVDIVDINFPKAVQELFTRELESKIRAKIDLENARVQIATLRMLKNGSAMIKDDENLKFLKNLELLNEALKSGKHSFEIKLS